MKERPILFSAEMVRAILDGRKTQTRRVVKPQPKSIIKNVDGESVTSEYNGSAEFLMGNTRCPYGVPGDRLILLSAWAVPVEYDKVKPSRLPHDVPVWTLYDNIPKPAGYGRTRTSRFAPKSLYSRFPRADVVSVRVERVQDISETDAIAEGVHLCTEPGCTARGGFHNLWDSINAKRGHGWDANDWVRVIEFKRLTAPDAPGKED